MTIYTCPKCDKIFSKKSTYDNHLKRKKSCELHKVYEDNIQNYVNSNNSCVICGAQLSNKYNAYRHIRNYCKKIKFIKLGEKHNVNINNNNQDNKNIKDVNENYNIKANNKNQDNNNKKNINNDGDDNKDNNKDDNDINDAVDALESHPKLEAILNRLLKSKKSNLKNENNDIESNNNPNITNNINATFNDNSVTKIKTITTTNNIININICPFGDEVKNGFIISEKDLVAILNRGFSSPAQLIDHIHFNKNLPQFNNIYLPNIRENLIKIFDGNKWIVKPKSEIILKLFNEKVVLLSDKYDEIKDTPSSCLIRQNMHTALKKLFDITDYDCDERTMDEYKFILRELLYNKRDIPKNTYKLFAKNKAII